MIRVHTSRIQENEDSIPEFKAVFKKDNSTGNYDYSYSQEIVAMIETSPDEYAKARSGNMDAVKKILSESEIDYDYIEVDQRYSKTENSSVYFLKAIKRVESDMVAPGIYRAAQDPSTGRIFLKPFKSTIKPSTVHIKNKDFSLRDDVKDFFTNKKDSGVRKNKKGVLLYGPPGNGKSSDIMALFSLVEELNLRIFLLDSDIRLAIFESIRPALEIDNTVFIMEELTDRMSNRNTEELLTFLDGENSWDNSYTIATTNYPEELPPNLVDRPGRFEVFIEYAPPTKEQISEFASNLGFNDEDISCLVGMRLSFDYISFILNKARTKNITVKETYELERERRQKVSATFRGTMGIRR